jgi:RNA polymerase sigma-70 factor, ECF subfamily
MGADVANPDFASFLQTRALERDLVEDRHERLGAGKPDSKTQKPYASPSIPRIAGTTTGEYSDEHLLARTSEGDREALSLLFRRYAHMVRALAERILRDASEAEDLVQEVFLFVFRKGALFDPGRGSARSWLAQVTYHRAFDRRRYLVSRHFYSNLELQEAVFREEEPTTLTGFYENSIEAALGRDALRRIDEALSEAQRLVMRLHFFDGYTLQEIAAVIDQSVGNVRNHYYRALEKMRKEVFTTKLQAK